MEGLQLLCQAVVDLELEGLLAEGNKALFEQLLEQPVVFQSPDGEMTAVCAQMWADPAIQETWRRRSGLQVSESFSTFVERIEVLARPDYVPSVEEVLLCRVRTTGITSQEVKPRSRLDRWVGWRGGGGVNGWVNG